MHALANLEYLDHSRLLILDLADTCGICLGMILLLVERYQNTASELEASEKQRVGLAVDNASLQFEIQNRKQVEEGLRRSEEFSRQVVLNSPVAMLVSRGPWESVESVNEKFIVCSDTRRKKCAPWRTGGRWLIPILSIGSS